MAKHWSLYNGVLFFVIYYYKWCIELQIENSQKSMTYQLKKENSKGLLRLNTDHILNQTSVQWKFLEHCRCKFVQVLKDQCKHWIKKWVIFNSDKFSTKKERTFRTFFKFLELLSYIIIYDYVHQSNDFTTILVI